MNIGSINIDNVYKLDHLLRPGETLASSELAIYPGGKGLNQSVALARARARVWHAGRVGADGAAPVEAMRSAGVNVDFVDDSAAVSGHAIIQVDARGENCILLYAGANHELDAAFIDRVLEPFAAGDILLLQNEVSGNAYAMQAAHARGMKIAINPAPIGPEIGVYPLELVSWLILNEIEGQALSGRSEPERILDELRGRYPGAAIILTVGRDGALYDDGRERLSHGIYEVPVVDTTAAGDTFTGYFLARVTAGDSPAEALRVASVASSIAVSRRGALDSGAGGGSGKSPASNLNAEKKGLLRIATAPFSPPGHHRVESETICPSENDGSSISARPSRVWTGRLCSSGQTTRAERTA